MSTLAVTEQALNLTLLTYVVDRCSRPRARHDDAGIAAFSPETIEQIDRLRHLPMGMLLRLTDYKAPFFTIQIDDQQLNHSLRQLDAMGETEQLLGYFISNGASEAMIDDLFPTVSKKQVQAWRKSFAGPQNAGRPRLPGDDETAQILRTWAEVTRHHADARKRFKVLHETYADHTLATLYALILQKGRM